MASQSTVDEERKRATLKTPNLYPLNASTHIWMFTNRSRGISNFTVIKHCARIFEHINNVHSHAHSTSFTRMTLRYRRTFFIAVSGASSSNFCFHGPQDNARLCLNGDLLEILPPRLRGAPCGLNCDKN